jgi:hypothetical protein
MDNGQISTVLITIAVAILGVFVVDPSILSNIIGAELYAKFGVIIGVIIVAFYNYLNPRNPVVKEEAVIPEEAA